MERNNSLDLLKLIAAFFVVVIHNPFKGEFEFAINAIARFAVPIFFMTTGYYLIKNEDTLTRLKGQIIKVTKLYIMYEIIYIVYGFLLATLIYNNLPQFKEQLIDNIKFILIEPRIGFHLWYLINLVWALLIIFIFQKYGKLKQLFYISIFLHIIGLLMLNLPIYKIHLSVPSYGYRNFLLFGLFYISLGIYIKSIDIQKLKISNKILITTFVLFCSFQIIEKYFWKSQFNTYFHDYFFSTIIACTAIFLCVLKCNLHLPTIGKYSKYCMPIYILHPMSMSVIAISAGKIFDFDIGRLTNNFLGNLIFILLAIIVSGMLYELSGKCYKVLIKRPLYCI